MASLTPPAAANRAQRLAHFAATAAAIGTFGCASPQRAQTTTAASLPAATATSADVLAQSAPSDWRRLDPMRTLLMDVNGGQVVIELAPVFAPLHVANLVTLAKAGYFDGLAIVRVQDNYVVQWGDPDGKRPLGAITHSLPQEYEVDASALPFTPLPDGDVYAAEVGWSAGFPVGRDPKRGKAWMAHCYGVVGVGRDMPPDTGLGNELYAVSGHAPRHLDRNLAMVGRVVAGMPLLTALPRGTGPLGFYERAEQRVTITRVRMASDAPAAEQPGIELLRTDTKTWSAYVASRRFRNEGFFVAPTGKVELCNVAVPTR